MTPTITISRDDLCDVVNRVSPFCGSDDDYPALTHVIVEPTHDGLRWAATDSYRFGCLLRGQSDIASAVLLQAELLDFATRAAIQMGVDEVTFEIFPERDEVLLSLPELRVPRPLPSLAAPDIQSMLDRVPTQSPAVLRLSAQSLRGAIHACTTFSPSFVEQTGHPVAVRTASPDTLEVRARWPDVPDTRAFVPVEADADVDTLINSTYLLALLDGAGDDDITLFVGSVDDAVRLRSDDGFSGLLMPVQSGQFHLEVALAEYLGVERDELVLGANDSMTLDTDGTSIVVSLVRHEDPFGRGDIARFVTVAARGVTESVELLREVNELNATARLSRIVLVDGIVFVAAENLVETLDPEEIQWMCGELTNQARRIGPLLEAVHG